MDNLIELLDRGYLYDGKTVKPGKINEALAAVLQTIGAIGKDQKNTFDGYKFRGIDDNPHITKDLWQVKLYGKVKTLPLKFMEMKSDEEPTPEK